MNTMSNNELAPQLSLESYRLICMLIDKTYEVLGDSAELLLDSEKREIAYAIIRALRDAGVADLTESQRDTRGKRSRYVSYIIALLENRESRRINDALVWMNFGLSKAIRDLERG